MTSSLSGHLPHLYEDPDISFIILKDILGQAFRGELTGTEKFDGQNVFISYSAQHDEGRAARNKGHVKAGGLNIQGITEQFADLSAVQASFGDVLQSFQNIIGQLPYKTVVNIFGNDANIFYNCEIIDPTNINVILYDSPKLVVQEVGHMQADKQSGQIGNTEVVGNIDMFRQAIANINNQKFKIEFNSPIKLPAMSDNSVLDSAYRVIDKELSTLGLRDNSTIGEYLDRKVRSVVESNVGSLPETNKSLLTKRIIGTPGISLTNIKKGLSREQKTLLSSFLPTGREGRKQISMIKKQAIRPIELVVHEFGSMALKQMQSAFILDDDKEIARLKKSVSQAIEIIESDLVRQHYPQAAEILKSQMVKLGNGGVDNIQTTSEGLVFHSGGKAYKLTGNFAPVNQILGILKYGRSNIAPINKLIQAIDDVKSGVKTSVHYMAVGGFKPPHKGHIDMIGDVVRQAKKDSARVTIFTGRSPRENINLDQSLQMMKIMLSDQAIKVGNSIGEVNILTSASSNPTAKRYTDTIQNRKANRVGETVYTNTPTQPLVNSIKELPERSVVFVFSSKYDHNSGVSIRNLVRSSRPDIEVFDYVTQTTPGFAGNDKLSATGMRKAISNGDYELFKQYLPDESQGSASHIWSKILNNQPPSQFDDGKKKRVDSNDNDILVSLISERLKITIKSLLLGEDNIEEISAMGAGAVTGPVGKSIAPEETLIRE